MIEVERYNKLKENYGNVASWAIWKNAGEKPKSNTDDLSVFDDDLNICEKLNDKYVFVGLNVSHTPKNEPWRNFQSGDSHQNDYKLRYALKDTRFWGSYITDIIKNHEEVKSTTVQEDLKKDPKIIEKHINAFKEELSVLSDKQPIIIAMGNATYNILKKNLDDGYCIVKIWHYSYRVSKEKYREKALSQLKEVE